MAPVRRCHLRQLALSARSLYEHVGKDQGLLGHLLFEKFRRRALGSASRLLASAGLNEGLCTYVDRKTGGGGGGGRAGRGYLGNLLRRIAIYFACCYFTYVLCTRVCVRACVRTCG